MPTMTMRNLSEETHRALKQRAAAKGRCAEAEVCIILDAAINPPERILIGSELAELGQRIGGVEVDIRRDQTPATGASFE